MGKKFEFEFCLHTQEFVNYLQSYLVSISSAPKFFLKIQGQFLKQLSRTIALLIFHSLFYFTCDIIRITGVTANGEKKLDRQVTLNVAGPSWCPMYVPEVDYHLGFGIDRRAALTTKDATKAGPVKNIL